jgi:hypothetical protein
MAVHIVDGLQPVQIDQHQRKGFTGSRRLGQFLVEPAPESAGVQQASQRILSCEPDQVVCLEAEATPPEGEGDCG